MKTCSFKVLFEKDKWPDEADEKAVWRAWVPVLPAAHAWGDTERQALENLRNAVELVLEDLMERGQPIPLEPRPPIADCPRMDNRSAKRRVWPSPKQRCDPFFAHPDGRRVTIHVHSPSQTLKIGTLKEIIENEARWSEEDLTRLGLL